MRTKSSLGSFSCFPENLFMWDATYLLNLPADFSNWMTSLRLPKPFLQNSRAGPGGSPGAQLGPKCLGNRARLHVAARPRCHIQALLLCPSHWQCFLQNWSYYSWQNLVWGQGPLFHSMFFLSPDPWLQFLRSAGTAVTTQLLAHVLLPTACFTAEMWETSGPECVQHYMHIGAFRFAYLKATMITTTTLCHY